MRGCGAAPATENLRFCFDSESVRLQGADADADKSSEGIVLFKKVLRRKT
jgi:hypothetical protein